MGQLTYDESADKTFAALIELFCRAVIDDDRISQRDNLFAIGRGSQNFLVAGHAGVEDDFAFSGDV